MDLQKRYSQLPDIDFQNLRFLFDAITDKFSELPAFRTSISNSDSYRIWTYADLKKNSCALGRFLLNKGLKPQSKVFLIGENHPEWCFSYIAGIVAGLVVVPVDASLDAENIKGLVNASGAEAIIFSCGLHNKIKDALLKETQVKHKLKVMLEFGLKENQEPENEPEDNQIISFSAAIKPFLSSAEEGLPDPSTISSNSPAVIIYTSGTTGLAKGIMLSHKGIIANINASIQALNVGPKDRFIAVLPLHHSYAATCNFLAPLAAGGAITFIEKIVPSLIVKQIKDSKVSFLIAVPLLFDKIKQGIQLELDKLEGIKGIVVKTLFRFSAFCSAKLEINTGKALLKFVRHKAGIASVRLGVAGGGPLAWDTASFFETIGFNLVQGYGMSENGPLISVNLPEYKDNRSVGLPVKNTMVRIADTGADGVGEIQVKSPSMMLGYLNSVEESAAVLSSDGWLKTGDMGYMDKRGFIYITGRSKSLIVTEGGKNVYPEEIELKFVNSLYIKEIMIIGRRVSGNRAGEQIIAVCYPDWERIEKERGSIDRKIYANEHVKEEIRAVNKTLPSFMKIVDFKIREEEFEKTSTKKIRRFLYQFYGKTENHKQEGSQG